MSFLDVCKKHLKIGLISQVIVTCIAGVVALIEGFIVFIIGVITIAPGGKYGPPPTPTPEPVVKYGAPVGPIVGPGQIDPGSLLTVDNVIACLVIIGSLLLYAWTFFGWIFWGSILYLKTWKK